MTLVELMVVVLIMGIVATAVYSVSLTTQKNTVKELDAVDLQDNLRLAMDTISKDIRKAGFMIGTVDPVSDATADSLRVNTACLGKAYGRVTLQKTATGSNDTLTLASTDMAAVFHSGGAVRIIRPPLLKVVDLTGGAAGDGIFSVVSTDTSTGTVALNGLDAGTSIIPGDILVATSVGAPVVNTIDYSQSGRVLVRTINGARKQYFNNITALSFSYDKDENDRVKMVTVHLTGTTNPNNTAVTLRTLELTSSITVRNL